ncbi:MAG: porin family protein [Flavobacteriales bacterium]
MKKFTLILMGWMIGQGLMAQDSLSQRFYVGLNIEFNRAYRSIQCSDDLTDLKTTFDSLETPMIGKRFGLSFGYGLSPKASIESGLMYSQYGYNIDTLQEANLNNIKYRFTYIEIPVLVNYRLFNLGNWQMNTTLGWRNCLMIRSEIFYQSIEDRQQQKQDEATEKNRFQLMPQVGIGFSKTLMNSYILKLNANHSFSVTPMTEGDFKRKNFSTGIQLSLCKTL